jgi:hypothetical protein
MLRRIHHNFAYTLCLAHFIEIIAFYIRNWRIPMKRREAILKSHNIIVLWNFQHSRTERAFPWHKRSLLTMCGRYYPFLQDRIPA